MKQDNSLQNLITEIKNLTIWYHDAGEGNIPVVFLHGFPFDKSMWNDQLNFLKSTHRVIAIDIRGFGNSTDENSLLTIDLFSDDLIAFLDKLNIEKAIICGLSMGGYNALNAVKRFPSRFTGLILCDTQCVADTTEGKEKRYKTIEDINLNGAEEFNEKFIKSIFHPKSFTTKKEIVEIVKSVVTVNPKKIITAGLKALAERSEMCSTLNAIHIPTLIICGREDVVTPIAQSKFMHEHIQGSIFKIIDNAGHVSNLEQGDEFNKHVLEFLNSLQK